MTEVGVVGLTAFAKSLNCGVCVVRNLGLIRRILSGIVIVLSELPTLWMFTDSFMPRRLWPRAFWTQALIILVENKTCHLAASLTQVLAALSVLRSLA